MTREEAKEGTIKAFHSQKGWFVKVKQAYAIERVCFSFVEKGTHGKGFDIYVMIDDFDILCDDILSHRFETALVNDRGDFPGAWKYVCGENGQNELAIGAGSRMPIVIQGRQKSENRTAFVGVVSYNELVTMAKWFKRTVKLLMDQYAETCVNAVMHRPKETTIQEGHVTLQTTGIPQQKGETLYMIPAVDSHGRNVSLWINRESMVYLGDNFSLFMRDLSEKPRMISMLAKLKDNNFLLLNDVKLSK